MPKSAITKGPSAGALAELDGVIDEITDLDAVTLEDQLQATAFAQECARQMEEDERLDTIEHYATETLEVASTLTAGALSTIPLGTATNFLVGGGAKMGALFQPGNRIVRTATRVGKVLLHSQLAITARGWLMDEEEL